MMIKYAMTVVVIICALQISGCASTGGIEVTGDGDAFSENIKISTAGYSRPFVVNPSDYFFVGYIDKKSGNKTYHRYHVRKLLLVLDCW